VNGSPFSLPAAAAFARPRVALAEHLVHVSSRRPEPKRGAARADADRRGNRRGCAHGLPPPGIVEDDARVDDARARAILTLGISRRPAAWSRAVSIATAMSGRLQIDGTPASARSAARRESICGGAVRSVTENVESGTSSSAFGGLRQEEDDGQRRSRGIAIEISPPRQARGPSDATARRKSARGYFRAVGAPRASSARNVAWSIAGAVTGRRTAGCVTGGLTAVDAAAGGPRTRDAAAVAWAGTARR